MYEFYYIDNFFLLVFFLLAVFISCILLLVSFLVANQVGGVEKLSPYECGFEPFEDLVLENQTTRLYKKDCLAFLN